MRKRRFRILALVTGLCFVLSLFFMTPIVTAQDNADWVNVDPSPNPGSRGYHGMAYDSESDVVILYGGQWELGPARQVNDTWAYSVSSNNWENMSPSVLPRGTASRGAMAYDSKNDVIILFGGFWRSDQTIGAETWAYDYNSNTWENKTPSVSPPGRDAQGMVYDSQSERIIMFGGRTGGDWGRYNDTWTYDYATNTWTNVTPDVSPVARWFHNMVYDTHADRTILFGGYEDYDVYGADAIKGDTWEFDLESETWTELTPTISPSPRAYVSMAYDIENQRTILYGGSFGTGGGLSTPDVLKGDTWAYDHDTNTWTNMTSILGPGLRMRHFMVYCNESGQMVMYGGQLNHEMNDFSSETWTCTYHIPTTSPTTTPAPPPTFPPFEIIVIILGVTTVLIVGVTYLRRR